ncbi:MAG: hypothetical protein SNJ68_15315 [Cyanobacteriota bacterium]
MEWWVSECNGSCTPTRQLGRGAKVTYPAEQVGMVTLIARWGEAQARVSFTVSPAEIAIAPRVKVIPDGVLLQGDPQQGSFQLTDSPLLPTLYAGDVVIGATLPPMQLTAIQQQREHWLLQGIPALPKQLIRRGSTAFEQRIDWNLNTPSQTVVEIPRRPSQVNLSPQVPGFQIAGDPTPLGLTVSISSELRWQPIYRGKLTFDESTGDGLQRFELTSDGSWSGSLALQAQGHYDWRSDYTRVPLAQENVVRLLRVNLGPVPIPVELQLQPRVGYVASMTVNGGASFNWGQQRARLAEEMTYTPDQDWQHQVRFEEGEWVGQAGAGSDPFGVLGSIWFPRVKVSLPWRASQAGVRLIGVAAGIPSRLGVDARLAQLEGTNSTLLAGSTTYVLGEEEDGEQKVQEPRVALPLVGGILVVLALGAAGAALLQQIQTDPSYQAALKEGGDNAQANLQANLEQWRATFGAAFDSDSPSTSVVLPDGTQIRDVQELRDWLEKVAALEVDGAIPAEEQLPNPNNSPTPTPEPDLQPEDIPITTPSPTPTPDCEPEKFIAWVKQFEVNAAQSPNEDWWEYENRVCGDKQYNLPTSDGLTRVKTDGIIPERCFLVDCKYSGSCTKLFATGKPKNIFDMAINNNREYERYSMVINDKGTPAKGLQIRVNLKEMERLWEEVLLEKNIPGEARYFP